MTTTAAPKINVKRTVTLTDKNTSVYCPSEQSALWAEHPRIYLHLDETDQAVCPYCNTQFVLKD